MTINIARTNEGSETNAYWIDAVPACKKPETVRIILELPRSQIENATTQRLARDVNMDAEALAVVGAFDYLLNEYGHWYDDLIEMTLDVVLKGRSREEFEGVRAATERWFERNIASAPVLA